LGLSRSISPPAGRKGAPHNHKTSVSIQWLFYHTVPRISSSSLFFPFLDITFKCISHSTCSRSQFILFHFIPRLLPLLRLRCSPHGFRPLASAAHLSHFSAFLSSTLRIDLNFC
jgi:hypothetical protein